MDSSPVLHLTTLLFYNISGYVLFSTGWSNNHLLPSLMAKSQSALRRLPGASNLAAGGRRHRCKVRPPPPSRLLRHCAISPRRGSPSNSLASCRPVRRRTPTNCPDIQANFCRLSSEFPTGRKAASGGGLSRTVPACRPAPVRARQGMPVGSGRSKGKGQKSKGKSERQAGARVASKSSKGVILIPWT